MAGGVDGGSDLVRGVGGGGAVGLAALDRAVVLEDEEVFGGAEDAVGREGAPEVADGGGGDGVRHLAGIVRPHPRCRAPGAPLVGGRGGRGRARGRAGGRGRRRAGWGSASRGDCTPSPPLPRAPLPAGRGAEFGAARPPG